MNLIDMKMDRKHAEAEAGAAIAEGDLPAYPYGLCLYLCDDSMKKLGLSQAPDAGQKFLLTAIVEVTSSGMRKTQDGIDVNADLQITEMALEPAVKTVDAAKFYPNSNMGA